MLAAFEEMNTRGVRFTMSDLARRLAVSKTTLYQHFASKDELIGAILDAVYADVRQQEERIIGDPALSFLEKIAGVLAVFPSVFGPINNRLIDDIQRHLPEEKVKAELFRREKWQRVESLIGREIGEGRLRPINLAVLQSTYMLMSSVLVDYMFLTENNLSARDALAAFAEILTFGLVRVDKGGEAAKNKG